MKMILGLRGAGGRVSAAGVEAVQTKSVGKSKSEILLLNQLPHNFWRSLMRVARVIPAPAGLQSIEESALVLRLLLIALGKLNAKNPKRQRTAALQDLAEFRAIRNPRSVLECGCPLPLWIEEEVAP